MLFKDAFERAVGGLPQQLIAIRSESNTHSLHSVSTCFFSKDLIRT